MRTSVPTQDLDELLTEVERAWIDRADATVVDRLAAVHPEHSAALYASFSALVDCVPPFSPQGDSVGCEADELSRRAVKVLGAWLRREGFERARKARRRPFVKFLLEQTDDTPERIARRVRDVSWEFIVLVGRYPDLVPEAVRHELVARIGRGWKIPTEEILGGLAASGTVPAAASRDRPFPPEPTSFEELLDRASLNKRQRAYWTSIIRS